jgi:hypothetical protein
MTIKEYIERKTKTVMSYYTALTKAASYFGEVVEDSFEYHEEYCYSELLYECYVIDVITPEGRKRIAISTYWDDYDLDDIKTLKVYDNYKKGRFNHNRHIIDREGNLYERKDGYGCKYEKVER